MTGDQPQGGSAEDPSRSDPARDVTRSDPARDVTRSDPAREDATGLDPVHYEAMRSDAHADDAAAADRVGDDMAPSEPAEDEGGRPVGDVYEWYVRGMDLLRQGSPAAAIQLLSRAADAEPRSRSVREALARAQYAAGHYPQAQENFAAIVEVDPADDYAQFGLGVAARRNGDLRTAVEHLALAVALRPGVGHYDRALRGARAALERQ
ncbi:MAG: tetratricopeptide repeat protein [Frankiaceae bacterium]